MTIQTDLRHGIRIGRAELTRSLRGYVRDTRRLVGVAVAVLVFGFYLLVSLPAVYALGLGARGLTAIPFFESAAVLLPVGLLLVATLRTVERIGRIDAEALLLTTVHPRAVVVGLITAEVGRLTLWFGLPFVALTGGFAVGLGSPLLVATAGLVSLPLVCWAAVWGYALGIAVLRVLRRLPTVRRVLKATSILVLVASVVFTQVAARYLAEDVASVADLVTRFSFAPLAEYLALGLVGTPLSRPVTPTGLATLAGLLALTPVGLAVAARQAAGLWFSDASVRVTASTPGTDSGRSRRGFSPPRPFSVGKAGRIAWGYLVRAVRHPQELSHLLMLVFLAGPLAGTLFQGTGGDRVSLLVAGTGSVVGVYLSGAAFGLNPLGDDHQQFPLLLLTETDAGTLLRGRLLAGLTIGILFAVLLPLGSIAAGAPALHGLVFAALGSGLSLLAALFALGLGAAYPVYEEREIWGAETVAPSTLVVIGYAIVVAGGTLIGLTMTWLGLTGHLLPTATLFVGASAYLLLTVGIPILSYRYALRRLRGYVVD